jgi:hypothetical protein
MVITRWTGMMLRFDRVCKLAGQRPGDTGLPPSNSSASARSEVELAPALVRSCLFSVDHGMKSKLGFTICRGAVRRGLLPSRSSRRGRFRGEFHFPICGCANDRR